MKFKDIDISNLTPQEFKRLQHRKGWALSFIGYIIYAALRLCGFKPQDYHGTCMYFEIGQNWGGFSAGWLFVCCKNASERTRNHEVGHGVQNAMVGGLPMLFYTMGSITRYWKRKIFKSKEPYDAWWFEAQATQLGNEYINNIKEGR